MSGQFNFDEKKTAQENIDRFLLHIESTNQELGQLLRKHLDKMLPLPEDPGKRSAGRAAFNAEIKKQLDTVLATLKAKHG